MISRRALLVGASCLVASPALAFPVIDSPVPRRLDQMIQRAGLWGNCRLALDAGDARSYTTGQTWFDLSPYGNNFFLGADGTATTTDPTFLGSPGNLSPNERFSYDGDAYHVKATANGTFIESTHKNNAAWTFYLFGKDFSTAGAGLFATKPSTAATAQTGILAQVTTATNAILFNVANGSGTALALNVSSTFTVPATGWTGVGIAVNEAAGSGLFFNGGDTEAFSATYSSPASGSATGTMSIAARTLGAGAVQSGTEIGVAAMFDRALTAAEFTTLNNMVRARFT